MFLMPVYFRTIDANNLIDGTFSPLIAAMLVQLSSTYVKPFILPNCPISSHTN